MLSVCHYSLPLLLLLIDEAYTFTLPFYPSKQLPHISTCNLTFARCLPLAICCHCSWLLILFVVAPLLYFFVIFFVAASWPLLLLLLLVADSSCCWQRQGDKRRQTSATKPWTMDSEQPTMSTASVGVCVCGTLSEKYSLKHKGKYH